MRNINFGIGGLHVKRQILMYFCGVISLLALVLIVSFDRTYKEVFTEKYWQVFVIWLPSKSNVVPLWPWRISILYKFQINISSNSREIKYQNIGRTHRHTDRQTRSKQYLATPSGGEVIILKQNNVGHVGYVVITHSPLLLSPPPPSPPPPSSHIYIINYVLPKR